MLKRATSSYTWMAGWYFSNSAENWATCGNVKLKCQVHTHLAAYAESQRRGSGVRFVHIEVHSCKGKP